MKEENYLGLNFKGLVNVFNSKNCYNRGFRLIYENFSIFYRRSYERVGGIGVSISVVFRSLR